jgi:hypothetical protein
MLRTELRWLADRRRDQRGRAADRWGVRSSRKRDHHRAGIRIQTPPSPVRRHYREQDPRLVLIDFRRAGGCDSTQHFGARCRAEPHHCPPSRRRFVGALLVLRRSGSGYANGVAWEWWPWPGNDVPAQGQRSTRNRDSARPRLEFASEKTSQRPTRLQSNARGSRQWMRGCCRSLLRAEIGPGRRAGAGDLPSAGRHPGKGAACCLQTVRGGGRAPVSR